MKPETNIAVVLKIVHAQLAAFTFSELADLAEAVKVQLARAKIDYGGENPTNLGIVGRAIAQIEPALLRRRVTSLALPTRAHQKHLIPPTLGLEIPRHEAANLVARLTKKTHTTGPNVMASAPIVDPAKQQFRRDRVKAAAIVAQEIVASIERCEALESAMHESAPSEADKSET